MANERSAGEIQDRFKTEHEYIQQYVEFLLLRSTLDDSRVFELNRSLGRLRLPKVQTRERERVGEEYLPAEIAALVASLDAITPTVGKALQEWEREEAQWRPLITSRGTVVEYGSYFDEWIGFLMQQLSEQPAPKEIEGIRRNALREAKEQTDRAEGITDKVIEDVFEDALDTVLDIKRRAKGGALQKVLDQFAELRLIARVGTPHAEINVLRQGFILLMTAFDAALFDLMRLKLHKDFFRLIGILGKGDKISFTDVAKTGSFDDFRDSVVEGQLKKRFLKDLLFILRHLEVECTDESSGDRFVELVEFVLRRNVHVHNRGIVDGKYLETDDDGKQQYNIYGLQLGVPATIDPLYWERANRLCGQCVVRVATWADS